MRRGSHDHQWPQVPFAQIGPVTIISVQKTTPTSAPATASWSQTSRLAPQVERAADRRQHEAEIGAVGERRVHVEDLLDHALHAVDRRGADGPRVDDASAAASATPSGRRQRTNRESSAASDSCMSCSLAHGVAAATWPRRSDLDRLARRARRSASRRTRRAPPTPGSSAATPTGSAPRRPSAPRSSAASRRRRRSRP